MSGSGQWRVRIDPSVQQYIRGTPPDVYAAYFKAAENVMELAETYSKFGIALCGEGFIMPIADQDAAYQCVIDGHKKEIYISRIKHRQPKTSP
jgi:hypothetical protein